MRKVKPVSLLFTIFLTLLHFCSPQTALPVQHAEVIAYSVPKVISVPNLSESIVETPPATTGNQQQSVPVTVYLPAMEGVYHTPNDGEVFALMSNDEIMSDMGYITTENYNDSQDLDSSESSEFDDVAQQVYDVPQKVVSFFDLIALAEVSFMMGLADKPEYPKHQGYSDFMNAQNKRRIYVSADK